MKHDDRRKHDTHFADAAFICTVRLANWLCFDRMAQNSAACGTKEPNTAFFSEKSDKKRRIRQKNSEGPSLGPDAGKSGAKA